ncbi:hypothetical protein F511_03779 [Dorcoceras hygrometricum]|uniref:Dystroglycan-like n=1 Tax=Dorcoceras hygrometricum TaxID=472368 RepID=A0A2Z7B590_9LAMI|nr:hypothetical protein F511_03779 [Dorcoceras hygrometricum]
MASSLISNSHHIDFESVFRLDDASMVQMFETLIATGLKEFLGCPSVFYEDSLTEFFANSSVREDGMVVSTIGGTAIEISQELFAAAFELPTEGLIDLTDVPKNFVFDARSLFSDCKEQVSMSCLKKALKFHYRLLHDILAKTIYVKAGSFDSVTRDRFFLMTVITFDVKINWSSILFGVFKEMVTPGSRQPKGYAIQICVLLRNVPGLELDAPRARRTPVNTTVSKKRPATGDDEVAPIIKKKRTTKGKLVAVKRLMVEEPDLDISTSGEPVAEDVTGEREPVAEVAPEDADAAIEQVLAQLESVFKHQDADRIEKVDTWFDEAFDEEKSVAEELMTIDDLLLQISDDLMLPSITAAEVTMIRLGEFSSIGDKVKAILVEDEQITENPASEIVALICRDVEVLVRVRDSVMKAVVDFFASFSLNTMPDMESLKDLKEKEKLMMEWTETNSMVTAVRRQIYLAPDQPWTDMAVQVINLLSAAHSQSLEDFKAQQQEHKIEMVQPNSSLPVIDSIDRSGVSLIEPARYWGAAPLLIKIWAWQRVCTKAIQFSVSGRLRPASSSLDIVIGNLGVERLPDYFLDDFEQGVNTDYSADFFVAPVVNPVQNLIQQRVCTKAIQFSVSGRLRPASSSLDIVIGNLGVERLPDYFLDDFEQGVNTDYSADFLRGSSGQSGSEFDSASSSGDTVYRSPSPPDYAYALGPPILSPSVQEERLYFVQSPDSSPAASPQQESSSSSSSDVSLHFDSADLPVHDHANTQSSAPVDSNVFTNALEDLRSSLSQRILSLPAKYVPRQSMQMNDLKKGLVAPVGTIFQDIFDIKKNQRAQEAKLNALNGQVAAIRNEQLEFQSKISTDLLSLSTQFAEIVDYIRGGDAKKGEGGSSSRPPPVRLERCPLPTPQSPRDVAGGSSAVRIPTFTRTTGTFTERAEQARRHILEIGQAITLEEAAERVFQADIRE